MTHLPSVSDDVKKDSSGINNPHETVKIPRVQDEILHVFDMDLIDKYGAIASNIYNYNHSNNGVLSKGNITNKGCFIDSNNHSAAFITETTYANLMHPCIYGQDIIVVTENGNLYKYGHSPHIRRDSVSTRSDIKYKKIESLNIDTKENKMYVTVMLMNGSIEHLEIPMKLIEHKINSDTEGTAEFDYDQKLADNADIVLLYRDNSFYKKIIEKLNEKNNERDASNIYVINFDNTTTNIKNIDKVQEFIDRYSPITDKTISSRTGKQTDMFEISTVETGNLFSRQVEILRETLKSRKILKVYFLTTVGNNNDFLTSDHGGLTFEQWEEKLTGIDCIKVSAEDMSSNVLLCPGTLLDSGLLIYDRHGHQTVKYFNKHGGKGLPIAGEFFEPDEYKKFIGTDCSDLKNDVIYHDLMIDNIYDIKMKNEYQKEAKNLGLHEVIWKNMPGFQGGISSTYTAITSYLEKLHSKVGFLVEDIFKGLIYNRTGEETCTINFTHADLFNRAFGKKVDIINLMSKYHVSNVHIGDLMNDKAKGDSKNYINDFIQAQSAKKMSV